MGSKSSGFPTIVLLLKVWPIWMFYTAKWTEDYAAAVQAISAVLVTALTAFLVLFTRRYVKGTEKALAISREQLQVLREQVEDQKRAIEISRTQHEYDVLESHREDLNTRILEPLRHALDRYIEPTFAINFSAQRYRPSVPAEENPVVAGQILLMDDPGLAERDSLDSALLEDTKQHHHRLLIAEWETFRGTWYTHRGKRRKWIEEISDSLLNESGLPRHGAGVSHSYIMDLSLAMFVYDRLMRRGTVTLSLNANMYALPVLSDGGTSYAAGQQAALTLLLEHINFLLQSQRQQAFDLQEEWSQIESQRVALSSKFSLAIATKTSPEKCPLVSVR